MKGFYKLCLTVLSIAFVLAIQVGLYTKVYASSNSGSSLTSSPIAADISTKPGETSSTQLEVMNNEPNPQVVNVHLEEFKAAGTSGKPLIFKPPSNDPSLSWVHFSSTSFTTSPHVWTGIDMTISLPKSASLGYYYAVLFTPQNTSSTQANNIKGSNAVLILVNTNSGNEVKRLTISQFTSSKSVYQYLPTTFNVLISNLGNIHVIPSGDIFISRTPNGKPIDVLSVNPGQGNVLPDSSRLFQVQWTDGFPVMVNETKNGKEVTNAKGQPVEQLQWNSSKPLSSIRYGKYYAHLVLDYYNGVTDVPINGVLSFWVIPWAVLLAAIAFILIVIALIAASLWRMNKRVIVKVKSRQSKPAE